MMRRFKSFCNSTITGNGKNTVIQNSTVNMSIINSDENKKQEKSIPQVNSVLQLLNRFILIYEKHGIQYAQLPKFISPEFNITYADLFPKEKLLDKLSPELLNWTCDAFGIQRQWLDGTEKHIYHTLGFYKDVCGFIRFLSMILDETIENIKVYAFKNKKVLSRDEDKRDSIVTLLFEIYIGHIEKKSIYKYIVTHDGWIWNYWRSRFQIKAIFYILEKLNINVEGQDLDNKMLDGLRSGVLFPKDVIDMLPASVTWYPEDYIDLPSKNVQSNEDDEKDLAYQYMREERYIQYFKTTFENKKCYNRFLYFDEDEY